MNENINGSVRRIIRQRDIVQHKIYGVEIRKRMEQSNVIQMIRIKNDGIITEKHVMSHVNYRIFQNQHVES